MPKKKQSLYIHFARLSCGAKWIPAFYISTVLDFL